MDTNAVENPMGREDVFKLLLKMSFPAILSMLIQSLYNITDSYFVAQYSEKALRATSLSYPIQIIIVGFGVGTGVGLNSYIARALGSKREDIANQGVMHGPIFIAISWLLFLIFRFFLMESFLGFFTTDLEVKAMGMEYLGLVTFFSIFSLTQITIEKTIQGTGNMTAPMIIQLLGAITNIILDPIMIFGYFGLPAMGIRGAAIATLIGQCASASLGVYILLSKKTVLRFDYSKFKFSKDLIRDIYRVGIPSILMQSVMAFVTTVLNFIVVSHSELAVSVLGIYLKLESFVMMPAQGLGQGVLPLVAYNFGAKNKERVKKTYNYGLKIAIGIMLIGLALFQIIPRQLIGIFTDNKEMIDMGVYTLRIISVGYVFAAVGIINAVYCQALGLGKESLIITFLRQFILIIPLAYILSKKGLNYTWASFPIAETLTLFVSIYIYKKVTREYIDVL